LHCNLDKNTHHLMNKQRLEMMKPDAVLVNAARGPCIDEAALVAHMQVRRQAAPRQHHRALPRWLPSPGAVLLTCAGGRLPLIPPPPLIPPLLLQKHPDFRCGLDVFEDEPAMKPGLADLPNAVIVPHIASASMWTRSGMVGGGWWAGGRPARPRRPRAMLCGRAAQHSRGAGSSCRARFAAVLWAGTSLNPPLMLPALVAVAQWGRRGLC
jgi:hypothetical protein